MYTFLFLARFFPFWGLPVAFVFFEVGMFFYYRRVRRGWVTCFSITGMIVICSACWLIFGGYWRLGPWLKDFIESFGT